MNMPRVISGQRVLLIPANPTNVAALISYTQDPAVQGPYKSVPGMTDSELEDLFLRAEDRRYFEVLTAAGESIGRLYLRAWRFVPSEASMDIELNIILKPAARGQGFGTEAQRLGIRRGPQLFSQPARSVFAYTDVGNVAEQRALLRCGMHRLGLAPSERYPVPVAPDRFVLFAVEIGAAAGKTL